MEKLVILTCFAKNEFKGALFIKAILESELKNLLSAVIIQEKTKNGLFHRISNLKKKTSILSIIKNTIFGLNSKPSIKEIILALNDALYCRIQSFTLKYYINYWDLSYDVSERKYMRLKDIIPFLKRNQISVYYVKELNSTETDKILACIEPNYIVLAGTGVIKPNIISKAKTAVVNCHSSILPGYRGTNSEFWALKDNNYDLIGHTVHEVNEKIDAGRIYLTKKIPIDKYHDNQFSLRYKNIVEGAQSTISVIKNYNSIMPRDNNLSESVYRSGGSAIETYQVMKKIKKR